MDAFTGKSKGSAYVSFAASCNLEGHLLSVERVAFLEFLQDPNLDLASVTVLWNSSNDLDCNSLASLRVDSFHNLAESPLSKETDSPVCVRGLERIPRRL